MARGGCQKDTRVKKKLKNKKVFVGLSGGVDSSVSAALLQKAGYDVTGVFIRTWSPDFIECTWMDERRDAMRVAAHLANPFRERVAEKEYKKGVADHMIAEYRAGRTPNPDVMCNREIKFGAFWRFAQSHGADFIATGHYAQNLSIGKTHYLCKGNDNTKDQAYFLWMLGQEDLAHVIFPIGHLKKSGVRKLAEKFGLPTAGKKDSQGICMLGDLDVKDFLSHYIRQEKGNVLDENGKVIGVHDGSVFLTLGERHGFTVTQKSPNEKPYYIIAKDLKKNTITVSQTKDFSLQAQAIFNLERVNFISGIPKLHKKYVAQMRYHGEFLPCTVTSIGKNSAVISFIKPVLIPSGQSVVVYDGQQCVLGGIA